MKTSNLTWSEFLNETHLGKEIEVTLIKPLRKPHYEGDLSFTKGTLEGFKCGKFGGGHSDWRKYSNNGRNDGDPKVPMSFDSTRMHWIKKPKVFVVYNCFAWGNTEYSDWVDVDNCLFTIKAPKEESILLDQSKRMFYEIVRLAHKEGWAYLFDIIQDITGEEYFYNTEEFNELHQKAVKYLMQINENKIVYKAD